MSIRILSAGELFPPSSDRDRVDAEDGFRGLDERFIALPARQRSRREGQSKSPCPCLPRSGLLIDLPSLPSKPKPSCLRWGSKPHPLSRRSRRISLLSKTSNTLNSPA